MGTLSSCGRSPISYSIFPRPNREPRALETGLFCIIISFTLLFSGLLSSGCASGLVDEVTGAQREKLSNLRAKNFVTTVKANADSHGQPH